MERGPLVEDIRVLRAARIVFLHHSVGQNILDAVARLDGAVSGERWPIVSVKDAARHTGGALVHLSGGANLAPTTKIDAFVGTLLDHQALQADIALMKFCYVDFDPETDVAALLTYYRDSIRALRTFRPGLRVAHMTVPLKARPTGLAPAVRRLLGMRVWEDAANARRDEFNRLLRAHFPEDPIFDLAAVETGTEIPAAAEEGRPPALDPRYTDDGGHLNPTGARVVAVAWLQFLAGIVRDRGPRTVVGDWDHPALLAPAKAPR
jgi:hypothetical protein